MALLIAARGLYCSVGLAEGGGDLEAQLQLDQRVRKLLLDDSLFDEAAGLREDGLFTVLLTRYNMLTSFRHSDMSGWTASRLPLFRDTCLPSVLRQSVRPDRWFIGFNDSDRDSVADVLALIAPYPWIVPVWDHGTPSASFASSVAAAAPAGTTRVLSLRLDNDDAVNILFVAACRTYAAAVLAKRPELDDFWLSFPVGLQYSKGRCALKVDTHSHYLGRCAAETSNIVNRINHNHLFQGGRVVFTPLTREPMWLENIHGDNVSNVMRADPLSIGPTDRLLRSFGLGSPPRGVNVRRRIVNLVASLRRRLTPRGKEA